MKVLHPKIKELKLKSLPVNSSRAAVNSAGELVDYKIEADLEERVIKGYLNVWEVVDSFGTIWTRGAFAKSIRERGPESGATQKMVFLWQHRQDDPIGQFRVLTEDDYGLYFEAIIDDVESGNRCLKQVRSGTINQFSIGFGYIWDKMEYDEKVDAVRLFEVELMEGSAVTFGSVKETYAFRSIQDLETERDALEDETEDFIKTVPKSRRLELRQLITRHIALSKVKPESLRATLDDDKPPTVEIDFKQILTLT